MSNSPLYCQHSPKWTSKLTCQGSGQAKDHKPPNQTEAPPPSQTPVWLTKVSLKDTNQQNSNESYPIIDEKQHIFIIGPKIFEF